MELLSCDVSVSSWTRWEDPGDYPNNIASGPLPPGPWEVECIEGCAVYQLEEGDMAELEEAKKEDYLGDCFGDTIIDIGGDYDIQYLYPDGYEYEKLHGFLVVVPTYEKIDGPSLTDELRKTEEWLRRTGRIKGGDGENQACCAGSGNEGRAGEGQQGT
jgi:hypothetical protein